MSTLQQLLDMGFPENRAKRAVIACKHDVGACVDWLSNSMDNEALDSPLTEEEEAKLQGKVGGAGAVLGARGEGEAQPVQTDAAPVQARSIKCEDCGKLLKSELDAQAHAARTQHTNFSETTEEVKPLTPEEKAAQLAKLHQRMAEKRAAREEAEKKEAIEKEKMRRKAGKEMVSAKEYYQQEQAKRAAEELQRHKREDALAKQRLKDEIAKDRAARAAKDAADKSHATPVTASTAATPAQSAQHPPAASTPAPAKEYTDAKLQLRLPTGTLTHVFAASDPLSAVEAFVLHNMAGPVTLQTTFPRRVYGPADMQRTLKENGLVPSAVLVVAAAKMQ